MVKESGNVTEMSAMVHLSTGLTSTLAVTSSHTWSAAGVPDPILFTSPAARTVAVVVARHKPRRSLAFLLASRWWQLSQQLTSEEKDIHAFSLLFGSWKYASNIEFY